MRLVSVAKNRQKLEASPIQPAEDAQARELFRLCHPDYPARGPLWFFAHPTLVLRDGDRLIGMTSFTLSPTTEGYFAYLMDTMVHPDYQGRGLGNVLFDARQDLAWELGAVQQIGLAAPDNDRMNHMLAGHGFTRGQILPDAFPSGPGVVWTRTR